MAIYHNGKNVKQIFGPRKINKVYSNNDLFFSSKLSKGTIILGLNRAIGSVSWASDTVMTTQNSYQLDLSKVENGITISFGKILSCDADLLLVNLPISEIFQLSSLVQIQCK
ncbi:hypothetical protein [Levilactobacillus brevis]|uniref:hypothetical protein n=1 Tax=Levilactobacillus brevis TaxID=1580 RepID=UPI000847F076|nr:hypothetical protein [Levilactobacillus brevis]ODP95409.1 hypothetical protein BGC39_14055 [Levilactobacillus brevis]